MGATIGVARQMSAIFKKRKENVRGIGEAGQGWSRHIEGALAEVAFAKGVNKFWDGSIGRFSGMGGDVGDVQVRHTVHQGGHLVIRPDDPTDARFVLVVGHAPTYRIVGSIVGADARLDHWEKDPGDREAMCWWIPQVALRPPKAA